MREYLNPVAELNMPDSGQMIAPEEAYKIKDQHQFFCPDYDCKDPDRVLIPVISGSKNYFFRHKGNFKHEIRPETLLHKSAIRWFQGKTEFQIPSFVDKAFKVNQQIVAIDPTKTECEYRKLKVLIPDVKLNATNGFEFAIEIFVTSDISAEKKKLIHEFGLPVVRIDLSKFYKKNPHQCRVDIQFINHHLEVLLTDILLKSWVIKPSQDIIIGKVEYREETKQPEIERVPEAKVPTSGAGCFLAIVTFGLIYLFTSKKG